MNDAAGAFYGNIQKWNDVRKFIIDSFISGHGKMYEAGGIVLGRTYDKISTMNPSLDFVY